MVEAQALMLPLSNIRAQLAQVIVELDMVSHVSAANLEPSTPSTQESKGGRRPAGGLDHEGDRQENYRQKTAEHFRRRAARCRSAQDYAVVLEDARAALDAWRRTPAPSGGEPEFGTVQWKRWVASSGESGAELARRFNVSPQYIGQVRKEYADPSAS